MIEDCGEKTDTNHGEEGDAADQVIKTLRVLQCGGNKGGPVDEMSNLGTQEEGGNPLEWSSTAEFREKVGERHRRYHNSQRLNRTTGTFVV